ncbi:MAG: alkaline phosphatase family protein [Dehalococcoidia bacterium]
MHRDASPRLLIIGLDGADWALLRPLIDEGAMPTLKALMAQGASATLESVLPTNSMSAWTSFMTGVNPGKHGVFDFVRRSGTPFQTPVTNSSSIRFPTMCEMLSSAGMTSCMIDMPPFYPPFAINGVMIGGIGAGAKQDRAFAEPPEIAERVEAAEGFAADVAWVGKAGREDELIQDLIALVDNRQRVSEYLLNDRPWDLFCTVFVAPDRLQHAFWKDLTQDGPRYQLARGLYERIDAALARLLDRIDTTATDVLIVSDHGFRPAGITFEVSQFLLQEYPQSRTLAGKFGPPALRFVGKHVPMPKAAGLALIDMHRKLQQRQLTSMPAYSDTSDAVRVNLVGRETTGCVPSERFDEVRDEVARRLLAFRNPDTGEAVIESVVKNEEYFHGEYAREAPDLVLNFHDGYAYGSRMGTILFDWPYCQGVHSLNGIVTAFGPHFRRGVEAGAVSIMDIAPTVLSLLGVASPEGTDGRPAEALLSQPAGVVAMSAPAPEQRSNEPGAYSEEEEALVKERLRGLGYIE